MNQVNHNLPGTIISPVKHEFQACVGGYLCAAASVFTYMAMHVLYFLFGIWGWLARDDTTKVMTSLGGMFAFLSGATGLVILLVNAWNRKHRPHDERWNDTSDQDDDNSIT